MDNEKSKVDLLIKHVGAYVETKKELLELVVVEKSSAIISSLAAALLIIFLFLLVLIFASIALAYGISQWAGQAFAGFLAVAGLYLVIAVVLVVFQERWLKTPIMNAIIRSIYKKDDDE
jgi:hypothetical protein